MINSAPAAVIEHYFDLVTIAGQFDLTIKDMCRDDDELSCAMTSHVAWCHTLVMGWLYFIFFRMSIPSPRLIRDIMRIVLVSDPQSSLARS
jgi:hypothetical protein